MPEPATIIGAAVGLELDAASLHRTARDLNDAVGGAVTKGVDAGMKEGSRLMKRALDQTVSASDLAGKLFDARKARTKMVEFASGIGDWFGKGITSAQKVALTDLMQTWKKMRSDGEEWENLMHERRRSAAKEIEDFRKKELQEQIETYGRGMVGVLDTLKTGELAGIAGLVAGAGRTGMMRGRAMQEKEGDTARAKAMRSMGRSMAGVGKSLAVIGVAAGVLATVIKVLLSIVDGLNDVNKGLLDMQGLAGMNVKSFVEMDLAFLNFYSHAALAPMGLLKDWKLVQQEIIELEGALTKGGTSFEDLRRQSEGATDQYQKMNEAIKVGLTIAAQFGISPTQAMEDLGKSAFETGTNVERVGEAMASISEVAKLAGFDTKRFYAAVLESTTGLGIYSVRLEEAAGMLRSLNNILGETVGAEFLKGISRSFKDMPIGERIKVTMLAGEGNVQRLLSEAAKEQAQSFANTVKSMQDSGDRRGVILEKAFGKMETLAERLPKMTQKEFRDAIEEAQRGGVPAETLREVERGRRLAVGARDPRAAALALQDLGPNRMLLLKLKVLESLGAKQGKTLDDQNDIMAMAAQAGWPTSPEELDELKKIRGSGDSTLRSLREAAAGKRKLSPEDVKFYKEQKGAIVKNGKIIDVTTGKQIRNFEDMILATTRVKESTDEQGEKLDAQKEEAKHAREKTEKASKALTQIGDGILVEVRRVADALDDYLPGILEGVEKAGSFMENIPDKIAAAFTGTVGKAAGEVEEAYGESGVVGGAREVAEKLGSGLESYGWVPGSSYVGKGIKTLFENEPVTTAGDFILSKQHGLIKTDPNDTIFGTKQPTAMDEPPGGAAPGGVGTRQPTAIGGAPAGAAPGAVGSVTVNIHGGDRRQVYETVRDALRIAGMASA